MQEINIHIAGQSFPVRSDADPSYVRTLADEINARFKAIKKGRPDHDVKALAMVAITLLDELRTEQRSHGTLKDKTRQFAQKMIARIDALLTQDMP